MLYDDRQKVSPGVKFKDSELIGVPTIVVVGKSLENGIVEIKDRRYRRAPRGRRRRRRRRRPGRGGRRATDGRPAEAGRPVEAVIFDWGGTLTPWHTVDLPQQWRVFAREVHGMPVEDPAMPAEDLAEADSLAMRIHEAEERAWRRGRQTHESATLEAILDDAGVDAAHDRHHLALAAYRGFWEPHTHTDPQVRPVWEGLRDVG